VTTFCSQLGNRLKNRLISNNNEVDMQKAIRKGLLPCPHCGGKAGLWQAYDSSWCVQCDRCGAMTMRFDKEEAVKRWNRRVKA
jgi:Lar family restriction alleviation protein